MGSAFSPPPIQGDHPFHVAYKKQKQACERAAEHNEHMPAAETPEERIEARKEDRDARVAKGKPVPRSKKAKENAQ